MRRTAAVLAAGAVLALAPVASLASAADADGGLPPWHRLADTTRRAAEAGLAVGPMAGMAQHIHAHLDVVVDGRPAVVPGGIGIDPSGRQFAEIHTHDESGILHIESEDPAKRFTLSQFFTEWGVRLDATHLGALPVDAAHELRLYVDGKRVDVDPAHVLLAKHEEIAVVYGSAPSRGVPAHYAFPPRL